MRLQPKKVLLVTSGVAATLLILRTHQQRTTLTNKVKFGGEDGLNNVTQTRNLAWKEMKELEMTERSERVRSVCARYGRDKMGWPAWPPDKQLSMFLDVDHGLARCSHCKVGTTTQDGMFLQLDPAFEDSWRFKRNDAYVHFRARRRFLTKNDVANQTLEAVRDSVARRGLRPFSFVRHPFERLASAFDSKVAHDSFPRFARQVVEQNNWFCNGKNWMAKCHHVNCHWRPYFARCAYCDIPYTIGKLESFREDMEFVFSQAGVAAPESVTGLSLHATTKSGEGGKSRTKRYFDQLSSSLKERLYQVFKVDFEMFGYDPSPYM